MLISKRVEFKAAIGTIDYGVIRFLESSPLAHERKQDKEKHDDGFC